MQAARQTEAALEENRLIQSMRRQTEGLEKERLERELLSDKQLSINVENRKKKQF